jgi:hypothetical protein
MERLPQLFNLAIKNSQANSMENCSQQKHTRTQVSTRLSPTAESSGMNVL